MISRITKIKFLAMCVSLIVSNTLYPVIIGSELVVSVQPFVTFPAIDLTNTILGFAWLKNGFALQNASTACTFDNAFPVSGTVNLNGGTLTLNQDLKFGYNVTLQGLGTIIANGNSITLPRSVTGFPATTNIFQDANIF